MRVMNSREKTLGGVTLALLAGALVFVVFFKPQLDRRDLLRQNLIEAQFSLNTMRGDIMLKDITEKRFKALQSEIAETGRPDEEGVSGFTRLVTNLCRPPLLLTSARPLPDVDEPFYVKFVCLMDVKGPAADVAGFLAAVAKARASIRVERMDLNCAERSDYLSASFQITKVVAKKADLSRPRSTSRSRTGANTESEK